MWWLVELLYILCFAMSSAPRWYCCCEEEEPSVSCIACSEGNGPAEWQVTFAGFVDCSPCSGSATKINGSFVCGTFTSGFENNRSYCKWVHTLTSTEYSGMKVARFNLEPGVCYDVNQGCVQVYIAHGGAATPNAFRSVVISASRVVGGTTIATNQVTRFDGATNKYSCASSFTPATLANSFEGNCTRQAWHGGSGSNTAAPV